jgi:hypothetical protein
MYKQPTESLTLSQTVESSVKGLSATEVDEIVVLTFERGAPCPALVLDWPGGLSTANSDL